MRRRFIALLILMLLIQSLVNAQDREFTHTNERNDQFVSVYAVRTGDWIEVLAPSGYSRFRVSQSWFSSSRWSMDSRHLAFIGRQQNMDALLVATIDEVPQPVSIPQG